MRKGKLSGGIWKWWNFKDKFILLKKTRSKKYGRKKVKQQRNSKNTK